MEPHSEITARLDAPLDLPGIMRRVANYSSRPRYTFMVLDLIARVAGSNGCAGPHVRDGEALVPIRAWLADAIAPIASRHHRRVANTDRIRVELATSGKLPFDKTAAVSVVEDEVRDRVRGSGMTAVSRAVSELVRAGLVKRHYQGYRVDHENRGAQRMAVYTVPQNVRHALAVRQASFL